MKRVTVRDIAAHAGVSIATVSRVLNDQSHVAPETRDLVQRTIEELGAQVTTRRPAPPGAIFLRCPYVLTDYFGLIVSSIAETLALHDRQTEEGLPAGPARQQVREQGGFAGLPETG